MAGLVQAVGDMPDEIKDTPLSLKRMCSYPIVAAPGIPD
jgi:hypothetical protein